MTRSELITKLSARFSRLDRQDADASVRIILQAISDRLAQGGRVEIRGFGTFSVNLRPARLGRNPKTGAPVHVPAKPSPRFKAGRDMREGVKPEYVEPIRKAA